MASSVKKKRAAAKPRSNLTPEVRTLTLTQEQAESLLDACTRVSKRHPMVKPLVWFIQGFVDSAAKLEELEIRLRSNSFWESDEWKQPSSPYLKPIKATQKRRQSQVLKELASLPASQVRTMVNGNGKPRGKPRRLQ